jgi:transcriptional regulator of NAD metabolism
VANLQLASGNAGLLECKDMMAINFSKQWLKRQRRELRRFQREIEREKREEEQHKVTHKLYKLVNEYHETKATSALENLGKIL